MGLVPFWPSLSRNRLGGSMSVPSVFRKVWTTRVVIVFIIAEWLSSNTQVMLLYLNRDNQFRGHTISSVTLFQSNLKCLARQIFSDDSKKLIQRQRVTISLTNQLDKVRCVSLHGTSIGGFKYNLR